MAFQITSLTTVYSTVYSGTDQRKHQSSASLAFVRGIHRWPVNSPRKWPVTRKMFPLDDVIMRRNKRATYKHFNENAVYSYNYSLAHKVSRIPIWFIGLTLIPTWIRIYTHYIVWGEITYPYPNYNGETVKVWEMISNLISHFTEYVITCPCWD